MSNLECKIKYGIQYRFVIEEDAEFIIKLRTNSKLSRYISKTDVNIQRQMEWIRLYTEREKRGLEFYFIFLFHDKPIGLSRIYNIVGNHFTQGSWVFSLDAPVGSAVLGNIISCEFAFDLPGMEYLLSDARKQNHTHRYVKSFHPEIIGETDLDVFYKISKENYQKYKLPHIKLCQSVMQQELVKL